MTALSLIKTPRTRTGRILAHAEWPESDALIQAENPAGSRARRAMQMARSLTTVQLLAVICVVLALALTITGGVAVYSLVRGVDQHTRIDNLDTRIINLNVRVNTLQQAVENLETRVK